MLGSVWPSLPKMRKTSAKVGRSWRDCWSNMARIRGKLRVTSAKFGRSFQMLVKFGPTSAHFGQVRAKFGSNSHQAWPKSLTTGRNRCFVCRNRSEFADIARTWSKSPQFGRNRPNFVEVGRIRSISVEIARDRSRSPEIVSHRS